MRRQNKAMNEEEGKGKMPEQAEVTHPLNNHGGISRSHSVLIKHHHRPTATGDPTVIVNIRNFIMT